MGTKICILYICSKKKYSKAGSHPGNDEELLTNTSIYWFIDWFMSNAGFPAMFDSSIHRSWPRNNWWGIVGGWEVRVSQRWHWGIFLEFLGGILLRWFFLAKNLLEIREWIFSEGCSIIFRKRMFFFFSWRSFQKTDIEATGQNGFSLGGSHFAGVWQTISNNAFLANWTPESVGWWQLQRNMTYDKRLYFSV